MSFRRGITFQIGVVFLLFALGLLGGVSLLAYTAGRATLLEVTLADLRARALEKEAALDGWADEQQADLATAAASPVLRDLFADLLATEPRTRRARALHDRLVKYLQTHTHDGQRFLTLLLLEGGSGKVVVATDPREEGKFKENRVYFREGQRRPFTQDLYVSLDRRGPAMTVAAPVLSAAGRPLGVLAGYLNLVRMEGIIGLRPGTRQTDDVYLVNAGSLLVTQPRLLSNPAVLRRGVHTPDIRRCLAGESGERLTEDHRGVPVIAAHRWLPKRRLCLVTTLDQVEAFRPARDFGQTILLAGGFLLLLAAAAAYGAGRAITRPILALQAGAARVGQGERDVRLPEASRNELGELARVFNRMAASVAEREAALLASEVQFRTAFENANSGMCLVDLGGRLTRVNRKMSEIFGYPREELEGMTVNSLTTPEDAAVSPAFIEQAVAGQIDTATFEKRYTHRDGHIVWGRVASSLVRDAAGRPAYFISQVQDITARRQAEAALRTREAQLRLFVEHAPAAIAMLDTEMCYLMASQRWLTSYGLTGQIVEGRSHYEIFPEIPERWKLIHKRCLAGAVERAEEDPFPRVDGSLQWLRWEIRPWYAVPGTIGGLLIFSEDITERKRDEDALRASLAEQEALLKEVHHRVKNNLQVVASLLRLQGSRVRDPEAQSALQETQNRVRAMSLLHETLYRSESLARVSGERYLGGLCAQLLRAAGPPAGVGLRLEAEGVEFGLEQAVPVGLILNELVSNALKHAFPTGGPGNIAVTLERLPSHRLLLRVADTGVGCPPEAERAGGGTLGLELVRRLVGQLGGSLELGPGPGTAWSVVFSMPGAEESSS